MICWQFSPTIRTKTDYSRGHSTSRLRKKSLEALNGRRNRLPHLNKSSSYREVGQALSPVERLFSSLLEGFEFGREVPQIGGLVGHAESAQFGFARVHFENRFDQVIDVALRVDAARDGQAQQFMASVLAEHHRAYFDATHACVAVELDRERLAGKFVFRNMRQHASGVDVNGVAA